MFVQDLHSVELVTFFVFDQHNSAEGAGSQSLEPVEIIQACCALRKYIYHRLGDYRPDCLRKSTSEYTVDGKINYLPFEDTPIFLKNLLWL